MSSYLKIERLMVNSSHTLMSVSAWGLYLSKLWYRMMIWATNNRTWHYTKRLSTRMEVWFSKKLSNTRLKSNRKITRKMIWKDNWSWQENMSSNCTRSWKTSKQNRENINKLIWRTKGSKNSYKIRQRKWNSSKMNLWLFDWKHQSTILFTPRIENS